ncbi:hypothetical protein EV193_101824 [Herbihabitans rhizosphaerae]|uniref:DUF5753 domain-containing protein n=2 Tax=Herbihabitans rhizosphaerae TaxID=1872711 RepID=A0A4V2EUL0_9PSEU|nr:hypothetical protein EV193_101824 [Herbihabitans rhizosphaerae]
MLWRTGPGAEVMRDQLHHLLRMSVRPNVSIRVIPDAVGFHRGEQPYHFMDVIDFHPVVHVEDLHWQAFLERGSTMDSYRRTTAALDRVALSEGQTRAVLSDVARDLAAKREDSAGPPR